MNIRAINNYCILEIIQTAEEMKKGLILLPGVTSQTPRWAKVLSTGEGVYDGNSVLRKPDVEVGDLVYVMAHGQYSIHRDTVKEGDNLAAASVLDIMVKLKDLESLQIQPLGGYVEIEKIEVDQKTEFGIELPDSRKVPTNLGRVTSVGIGWTGPFGNPIPMQVKVGDKIIYSPLRTLVVDFSGLGLDDKRYLIQHGDIIGVVEE
jgi:chaperonin GroES